MSRARLATFLSACVLGCAPRTLPTVSVTASPVYGDSRIQGTVTLAASTLPVTGIDQVEFIVDSLSVGVAKAAPFSIQWESDGFTGQHVTVTARARTMGGDLALSAPIRLAVDPSGNTLPLGPESMYTLLNQGSLKIADELLENLWDLGARSDPKYLDPSNPDPTGKPIWQQDPYNDPYWRLLFYSLRPSVNLLWAFYTVGDPAYRDKLIEILRSYCAYDQNYAQDLNEQQKYPYLDENYAQAFRAMVLTNTYVKLKRSGDLPADLDASLLTAIKRLGDGLYPSVGFTGFFGNHGFTSAAVLPLLARNFPQFPDAQAWSDTGVARLNNLSVTALDVDGVEIENSPFYHYYVMTFAQEIQDWGAQWGVALGDQFLGQSKKMAEYATYILQPDGRIPLLGASVTMNLDDIDPQLEAAVVLRDPAFQYVTSQGLKGTEPTERIRFFKDSGETILRSGFGPVDPSDPKTFDQQTFMTFNVGPWRNAHNHLDVLGLTYYSAGRILLPDSGLNSYVVYSSTDPTVKLFHDYFFSTRAHNTVVVDDQTQGQGQLVQAGLSASGPAWAYQSGSQSLTPGVTQRRAVLLLQRDLALVLDRLLPTDAATHDVVQTWHFAPELGLTCGGLNCGSGSGQLDAVATMDATPDDTTDNVRTPPVMAMIQGIKGGVTVTSILPDPNLPQDRIQGWFSQKYGVKVPNTVLEYKQSSAVPVSFATLLASGEFADDQLRVTVDQDDDAVVRARICTDTVQYQVEVDNLSNGTTVGLAAETVQVTPITTGCN